MTMNKICLKCKKEFSKPYTCSKKEWSTSKYCSHSCANSINSLGNKGCIGRVPWNKGVPGLIGKANPNYSRIEKICKQCGNQFIVKNYRKDEAEFCSRPCSYKFRDKGLTSINYRIRRSAEFKNWRELVFERDDWTCLKCLERGGSLHPHHIQNFSENEEIRFNIDNGATLCRECHYDFHTQFGFTENTIEQFSSFLAVSQEA